MRCFVCGTLRDPDTAGDVLGEFEYAGPATLEGLHRVEGAYPTLGPGGSVQGRILLTDDVDALDHDESVDRGLYVRVTVPHADGGTAETYVGDPNTLAADVRWPGNGPFQDRLQSFLADALDDPIDVCGRP